MGDKTGIQWTDASWNPITGCDKVSPGCAHCYAEEVAARFWKTQYSPVQLPTGDPSDPLNVRPREFTDVQCHADRLDQPLRWKRPRKIFVNSMSDLFHEAVPDTFIDRVFAVMALCDSTRSNPRNHTFQVLTKRAERMQAYLSDPETPYRIGSEVVYRVITGYRPHKGGCDWSQVTPWPLENVWAGVSVENQHFADERVPLLLQTPAAVRFLSCEPLLEEVDIRFGKGWQALPAPGPPDPPKFRNRLPGYLHWVIVGGESGKNARPFNVRWARSIVRQCKAARVAVFVKQLGKNVLDRNDAGFDGCSPTSWPEEIEQRDAIEDNPHGFREEWQGADVRVHLRDSHGGDLAEWPADLRVRQFPEVQR